MTELAQELMTPDEAAKWFRRSTSWLRQQRDLLHVHGRNGQPLYHVRVCRAYVLGKMRGLSGEALRQIQVEALATACGLASPAPAPGAYVPDPARATASASAKSTAPS
jgi:hypothetical protein